MAESTTVECGPDLRAGKPRPPEFPTLRRMRSNRQGVVRNFPLDAATISAIVEPGAGRPVLFLHGNSSCKEIWLHQIEAVRRKGRPVLAPDLPGHGDSGDARDPTSTYSFPGYAAVVGELLDQLKWTAVDVVGWSLGGHIGLELLATDRRLRSLAIVGTPPANPSPAALAEAFHGSPTMQLTGKRIFSESDALSYATSMLGGEKWVTPQLLAAVRRTDGFARQFMISNALEGRGVDQRRLAEADDTRLCVMHGEKDPFVRLDYLLSLKYQNLWTDRVYIFSGAGHAPHWQYPAEFNKLLDAFLSGEETGVEVSVRKRPAGVSIDGVDETGSCRNLNSDG